MVRERTPARSKVKPVLGSSWVVESDGDDEYTPPSKATSSTQNDFNKQMRRSVELNDNTRTKISRNARSSEEPELIMPSIYGGSVGGSWLGEEKRREIPQQRKMNRRRSCSPKNHDCSVYKGRRPTPTVQDRVEAGLEVSLNFLRPILKWIYEVLAIGFQTLKTPIAIMLAAWFLVGLFIVLRNIFFASLSNALSPLCRIPGIYLLHLPFCHSFLSINYNDDEPPPVQFDQLMTVQNRFEEVLQESAGGVSLPLDMKRGETSIRDLKQVVRFSQLHSKNELVLEFDGFIETARIASYDLQKFNSHVGRGVDNILATARWTKRVLGGIAERDASKGAITSFFSDKILAPFQPLKFTEDTLLDQYMQHTRVVEDEVNRLVAEAQALLMVLQNLEDRLDVIHGIAIRDNLHTQGSKAEVLSQLWTMLGGNRKKLGKFDSQLRLLQQVDTYRQNAIAHVSGTLVKLQGMGAELEELRERVGSVELLGGKGAIPLRLHIENIEMGVERLEKGRKGAKELENEEMQKSLGRGKTDGRMIGEK